MLQRIEGHSSLPAGSGITHFVCRPGMGEFMKRQRRQKGDAIDKGPVQEPDHIITQGILSRARKTGLFIRKKDLTDFDVSIILVKPKNYKAVREKFRLFSSFAKKTL